MIVRLGTVDLSENLILDGLESGSRVAHSARRTLGGRMVVQVGAPLVAGRPLTLSGVNSFTLKQITDIKVIESAGLVVDLVHHRGIFKVLVVEVDPEQSIRYHDPEPEDWYSATITMLEVQ